MHNGLCTCIVPFHNEGERLLATLSILVKVKNLSKIICVDDGSDDNMHEKIKQTYKNILVIRLPKNQGKSAAVLAGLGHVETMYTMLFDADIHDFANEEVERAIANITGNQSIDMLILRRVKEPAIIKLTRGDLVISGERILYTKDLLEIFKSRPTSYQLEIAINMYMKKHKKHAYWFPYSGRNTLKLTKEGVIKGMLNEIRMYQNVVRYNGLYVFLWNLVFFCRKKYSSN